MSNPHEIGVAVATDSKSDVIHLVVRSGDRPWVSVVALLLSFLAVVVSVGIALWPGAETRSVRANNEQQFLDLVASARGNAALSSRVYTVSGSDADKFAVVIANVWKGEGYSAKEQLHMKNGSATPTKNDTFRVCFPKMRVEIFAGRCVIMGHFEFDNQNLIRRFTVDSLPVESVIHEQTGAVLSKENSGPVDIYAYGTIVDPPTNEQVSVFWMQRRATPDRDTYTATLDKVIAQDESEADRPILEMHFPDSLKSRQTSYAVIRTSMSSAYLQLCWTGIPATTHACEWTYGLN